MSSSGEPRREDRARRVAAGAERGPAYGVSRFARSSGVEAGPRARISLRSWGDGAVLVARGGRVVHAATFGLAVGDGGVVRWCCGRRRSPGAVLTRLEERPRERQCRPRPTSVLTSWWLCARAGLALRLRCRAQRDNGQSAHSARDSSSRPSAEGWATVSAPPGPFPEVVQRDDGLPRDRPPNGLPRDRPPNGLPRDRPPNGLPRDRPPGRPSAGPALEQVRPDIRRLDLFWTISTVLDSDGHPLVTRATRVNGLPQALNKTGLVGNGSILIHPSVTTFCTGIQRTIRAFPALPHSRTPALPHSRTVTSGDIEN